MNEQEQTANSETKTPKQARRGNGLLIFAIFAVILFAINYKPSVETIYCNAKTLSPKPEVIMLGATWCPYCYKARKYFIDNEVSYCEYDIEDDGKGKQIYTEMDKNPMLPLGIPVLLIGDYKLSGFDQRSIEKALSINKGNSN